MDNCARAVFCLSWLYCICSVHSQGLNDLCQFSPDSGARGSILFIDGVREDLPIGATVTHLLVNGDDTQVLMWSDAHDYFHFDVTSRNITVGTSLTHTEAGFRVSIKCRVLDPPSSIDHTLRVEIRTLDLNDHAPQFINAPYYTNISEMAPVGTTLISTISATDEDTSNPFVLYSVLPGPFSDHFEFPLSSHGKLALKKMVDFEEVQVIVLNIQATDNHPNINNEAQQRLTDVTTVTVHVFDESDQNPIFNQATYLAMLTETDQIGTMVVTDPEIRAYDPDIWQNSTLIYSIVPDSTNEHTFFYINEANGELTLAKQGLLRGTKFCILVQVSKQAGRDRYSQALVRVWVQPANDSPPQFIDALYAATLVENTPVGSPVVTVEAVDNDEATILRYSFADDYPEFVIDSMTGAITTALELNFEDTESFSLQVMVTDGQHGDEARIEVTILNTNDHNPVYMRSHYTIDESEVEKDQLVIQVQATDGDRYSTVTYSFLNNSTYTNFSIHERTGEVKSLIGDAKQTSFVVVARDNGNPPRTASCLIHIWGSEPRRPVAASVKEESDSNLTVVIVLSVLAAILFIVIIILTIYIIRRRQQYLRDSQSKSRCVRSQSFEQNPMNFSSKNYKSYLEPVNAYKPNERHLQLYNGVPIEDATSTQENPFSLQDNIGHNIPHTSYGRSNPRELHSHSAAVNAGLYPQHHPLDGATLGSSSDRRSGSTLPRNHSGQTPHVAQIDYDSTLSPMEMNAHRLNGFHGYSQPYTQDMQASPRSSVNSEHSYNHGELTSFKVGSTTQLVPPTNNLAKSSRSISKGSGNISFVDNSPTNSMYSSLTSQQSGIDPGPSEHHKPGITVYY